MKIKKAMMCLVLLVFCMGGCLEQNEIPKEKVTSTPNVKNEIKKVLSADDIVPTKEIMEATEPTSKSLPTSTPEPTSAPEPTSIPEPTSSPDKELTEDYSKEYLMELSIDTEFITIPQMIADGTITGYVRGDTKFLVWKYVAMGINTAKEYRFAVVDYKGDFEGDFFSYDEYIENPHKIEHLGGDIFQIVKDGNLCMCHNTEKESVFWYNAKYDIIKGFWDGYALAEYGYEFEMDEQKNPIAKYGNLAIISDEGEVTETNLRYYYFGDYISPRQEKIFVGYSYYDRYGEGEQAYYSNIGKYSEGYFFLNNIFYDIELNPILDLGDIELVNQPYFYRGYSWIEYKDSDAVWGAYMDIDGNFIEEARRLYVLD